MARAQALPQRDCCVNVPRDAALADTRNPCGIDFGNPFRVMGAMAGG
jgi:hypothetical protein